MGIRKLNKFLVSKNSIKTYRNIREFVNKIRINNRNNSHNDKIVIAVDFWLYAHKFLHSRSNPEMQNVLHGFWNQIMRFLSHGIIPLYVMDGVVPIEKQNIVELRAKKYANCKKNIDILDIEINKYVSMDDIDDDNLKAMYARKEKLQRRAKKVSVHDLHNICLLFDTFGIPYIRAEYEADALCAKLFKNKIITSCLSDDMDILAFGCGSTIKFHKGMFIEFNLQHIYHTLGFDQNQLIDMCIIFGCDYLHHPLRLDCNDAYNMIKKHGSLLDALNSNEHTIFNIQNSNVKIIGEHYYRVKDIYMNNHDRESIPCQLFDIKLQQIKFDELVSFLKKINILDKQTDSLALLEKQIANINQMIANNIM